MSAQLDAHPYFEAWTDPESGVVSYILTERVAPVQQSFYFTNLGISADGKWLWFYVAFPPSPMRMLAVVSLDPHAPMIRYFPASQFRDASPMVVPEGDAVYFAAHASVWRMGMDGVPTVVCRLPEEYLAGRSLLRFCTHLTLSSDGKYLLIDGRAGTVSFLAKGDIKSGEICILKEFAKHVNHAAFSPAHPDLFLFAEDWGTDPFTGQYFPYDHRIWLMDIAQTRYAPLRPDDWYGHGSPAPHPTHEWWSTDGFVCWVDYGDGVMECHPDTRETNNVWTRPLCHAHCNADRTLFCADHSPYAWPETPCKVLFYNRQTGDECLIVSALPAPSVPSQWYHLDPHPQFSPDGNYVTYTTTVRGIIDVAICPVAQLVT